MTDDLLPCPFCGGDYPYTVKKAKAEGGGVFCYCGGCNLETRDGDRLVVSATAPTAELLAMAWNKRAVNVSAVLRVAEEMERESSGGIPYMDKWAATLRKAVGK